MLSSTAFYDLISGRRRGFLAGLARAALRAVEIPYAAVIAWRNGRFDSHTAAIQRVPVPVISVGNLTLGGVGKTPMVEWIARWLLAEGVPPAIISRGYKASSGRPNDEALELAAKLPGVPHFQNPRRIAAACAALRETNAACLVLDDAFQHRALHRDLDIVLIDALEPFGYGHLFPRGALREPLAGLRRAQAVVLSRADAVSAQRRAEIRAVVRRYAPDAAWAEVRHAPRGLLAADGRTQTLDPLRGRPIAAFCGLGNPAGFRHTLAESGLTVAAFREFPDHHLYTADDAARLAQWAEQLDAAALVCTQKDLVKISSASLGRRSLWALVIGLEFLSGQAAVEACLRKVITNDQIPMTNGEG